MKTIAILLSIAAISAAALAQEVKPGPEQKKLDLLAGTWTIEGDMKSGSMGPAGKMTENEKCEWMDGNFFLICHATYQSSQGNGTGLSILGYSSDDKSYTYREFNSWGEFTESKGSVNGDTWTWLNEEKINDPKMGAKTYKGKFTMRFVSSDIYNFTFEMSEDGTKWTTVMDGKAAKK